MEATALAALTLVPAQDWNDDAYRACFIELYDQLRHLARKQLNGSARVTLCTTVLVHEAYLKLRPNQPDVSSRGRFYALAAKAMRCVLVDHIRANKTEKRGGDLARITLVTDVPFAHAARPLDLLEIEQALEALQEIDPRMVNVVECHFYGGMEFDEIAEQLGLSVRTVHRDWRFARAFLQTRLSDPAL
ncbi:ECF-type sigma factor [Dyella tabacisoli]|uniref:RNA polymerase subunit sigma n=1 Tax=Dyella tabacisoli TaxID=2282381 RepID=A0A369UL15_9GAMM|nr:ECF-type sigma factor [Dyella tabacisoli]RDD80290.1 RNA polymerase subunit sigma [Dyella tabacisoli]